MPRARRKPRWLGPAAPSCTPHPQLPRPHFRERLSYGEAPPRRLGRRGCRDEEGDSGAKGRRGNSRPGNGGARWPTRGARGQACGRPTPWAGPPTSPWPQAGGFCSRSLGCRPPMGVAGCTTRAEKMLAPGTQPLSPLICRHRHPLSCPLPTKGPAGQFHPRPGSRPPPPPPLKPQRHERQHTAGGEAADALTRPCRAA